MLEIILTALTAVLAAAVRAGATKADLQGALDASGAAEADAEVDVLEEAKLAAIEAGKGAK